MALNEREKHLSQLVFWFILLFGLVLPWVVALWVKLTLQAQGSPTWPWRFFLNPGMLVVEVVVSLFWGLPFTGLAMLSRYGLEMRLPLFNVGPKERLACICLSFGVGVYKAIPLFRELFWKFHPISFLYPWFVWHGGLHMLLALVSGWIVFGLKSKWVDRPGYQRKL